MAWMFVAVVSIHAMVLLAHDAAHRDLGVALVPWQNVYVYSVIVVAPLVAAGLSFTRYLRAAAALLTLAMLGSLAFGVYHHYVGISPDHVAHLPPGDAQPLFRQTAALMAVVEALAAGFAASAWSKAPRAH